MPRKKRFHAPGALYHVIMRGNDRQPIFFCDADRLKFYALIQEGVDRYQHQIHAFCLMTNHLHLFIQVREVKISKIIHNLAFRYCRYINRIQGRLGHLFQGRFHSYIVDSPGYVKTLIRYIHLNPIHAGITDDPEKYRWCSHRAYLNRERICWLTKDFVLDHFMTVSRLNEFVHDGVNRRDFFDIDEMIAQGFLNDTDCQTFPSPPKPLLSEQQLSLPEIIRRLCSHYQIREETLKRRGKMRCIVHIRSILAYFIRETSHLTLQELANYFKCSLSNVSRQARRMEEQMKIYPNLKAEVDQIFTILLITEDSHPIDVQYDEFKSSEVKPDPQ